MVIIQNNLSLSLSSYQIVPSMYFIDFGFFSGFYNYSIPLADIIKLMSTVADTV